MAGEVITVTKPGVNRWKRAHSGTGPFERWRNSRIDVDDAGIELTEETEWLRTESSNTEPEAVEVIDTDGSDVAEQELYPGFVTLQWRDYPSDARWFHVEQYISSVWTALPGSPILQDGRGYYSFDTPVLDDVTEHQFRVYGEDGIGNTGRVWNFTVFMIRNPDVPSITATYSNPNVTIAAA